MDGSRAYVDDRDRRDDDENTTHPRVRTSGHRRTRIDDDGERASDRARVRNVVVSREE